MSDEKDILEKLPSQPCSACKDCGSIKWDRANNHPDGGFHQCEDCTSWDEKSQKLKRKNLQ